MKNFDTIYNYDNLKGNFFFNSELELRAILANFLKEDIGTGDITSNLLIPKEIESSGTIVCKTKDNTKSIVASGLKEAILVFEICGCKATPLVEDGSIISTGTEIMSVNGSARSILKAERTALNIIMRMSGISTKTRQFVDKLDDLAQVVRIASTRKTAPGLRYFDKKAVILGGGISHRTRMDQLILIKDNHISIVGSVRKAIELAKRAYGNNRIIECEVVDQNGIFEAIRSGADIVMLDNFTPERVRGSLEEVKKAGLRDKIIIEISGGINYDNIYDYASSRPDVISIGSLTHSVESIDYSLEISSR
ncbi:carboxylating nicotinate-nucleotide diphosphorylase [Candidatus Nitrosocosmicus franklandus]|uniref:Nicotinate-nucleotide pyrophosphorylase [carboxylating] n=1 Tax=Candidatus Nitrosocosmicus franklandianus TaxID=1798806 RepID=A0A484IF88_9ARCH|nr:carboxylating nicotinate-nucleotide diphosphorylase [Candidatus Nitrosocosmicus franklandus]VFJ14681.1 putative nicotinate-nucleotide pyrophosphorylase [carboxylating] [Candidatus Nitrosocosmicus franklandus]